MDLFTRLALAAIGHCLDNAGLSDPGSPRSVGIVAATEYACLATDSDFFGAVLETGGTGASPGLFSYTLPSSFLGEASILYRLNGPTYIVSEGNLKGIACLEMSLESILLGETRAMLCGIVNPLCPPTILDEKNLSNGALFLALERPAAPKPSYGVIGFNRRGHIEYKDSRIVDLPQLVRRCLNARECI
jgi:3-oxoacyl-(acyl-carrier-protein) synthase